MPAERQQRAAFENRLGVLGRLAEAVDPHADREFFTFARGDLHIAMGNGAGGQVKNNRRGVGPWRGEGNRIGAEQWPISAMGHHAGHAVDHAQRDQTFVGEGLDIRPQSSEMMRVANRQHRDPGMTCLLDQQWSGRCQRWLGKTVASINPDKSRRDVFNLGHRMAIDPTTFQRRDITGDAKHAMTVGAVAFGVGAVGGQHPGDVAGSAVAQKNRFKQLRQCLEGHCGRARIV